MQKWMISANGKIYDHASAFEKWGYIDWRQRVNYSIGDIVYIYCTQPYKRVMYKTVVEKHSFSFNEITDDREFWYDIKEYEKGFDGKYVRLKLIEQTNNELLSLDILKKNGLRAAPQGPIRINEQLSTYLELNLKDDYSEGIFPESDLPEDSYEGAVKTTIVNKYERSSIARNKCIEYHGCNCAVCGMSFEKMYGDLGKGFIHVHHIVPLNQIGKEYRVDFKKDLVPVCPNCHAMLHRKKNTTISIEELKTIINKEN